REVGGRLGFGFSDGFAERIVYREFFPRGLSALDDMDERTLGSRPSVAHLTARQEVEALLASLKLPIDERGRRRAEARAQWLAGARTPPGIHDNPGGERGPRARPGPPARTPLGGRETPGRARAGGPANQRPRPAHP